MVKIKIIFVDFHYLKHKTLKNIKNILYGNKAKEFSGTITVTDPDGRVDGESK